jgi:hypothetical protein
LDFDDPTQELPLLQPKPRVQTACRSRHRVIKTIRLNGQVEALAEELQKLAASERVNLLHLVRDPRGTLNSALRAGGFFFPSGEGLHARPGQASLPALGRVAERLCRQTLADAASGEALSAAGPDALSVAYFRVDYEETARRPREVARRLFCNLFAPSTPSTADATPIACADHALPSLTRRWIDENTREQAARDATAARNVFSTRRHSAARADAWRSELSPAELAAIEGAPSCRRVIAMLGHEDGWADGRASERASERADGAGADRATAARDEL